MASVRHRALPSVLHNFLATVSSRNADYDGFWVFGWLVSGLGRSTVDLLADEATSNDSPWRAFVALARDRFAEQLRTNSVTHFVRRAELTIERGAPRSGIVNGSVRNGFEVSLSVEVVSDRGRVYRRHHSLFVAPHDPSIERRSVGRGAREFPALPT